jgi:hypothetical protein
MVANDVVKNLPFKNISEIIFVCYYQEQYAIYNSLFDYYNLIVKNMTIIINCLHLSKIGLIFELLS